MGERFLQKVYYRLIRSRRVRIFFISSARLFGFRHLMIRFDINNTCNLRCKMCATANRVRNQPGYVPAFMKIEDFKHIARQVFPKTYLLYLSCQHEPLMTRNFGEFLETTSQYKIPFTSFATNGMLLNQDIVDASIKCKLSQIVISMDGASPDTLEEIRSGTKFAKIVENLQLIKDRKDSLESRLPEVRSNYVICKINWHEVSAYIDLANKYGVDSLQFRPLTPHTSVAWAQKMVLNANEEDKVKLLLKEAREKGARYGIKFIESSEFTYQKLKERKGSMVDECVYPWFYRYIMHTGDMKVCPWRESIGNLLESSYKEIMKSDLFNSRKKDVAKRAEACLKECAGTMKDDV
ncbi:radical SAM protein [candidate division WOR-3 bacterium]|uniref:Radical SAM protein n=1 Tax=candidate division WOR-3 bacterium TaxID=2052148 RepID=A0A9D5QCI1_UNCW3|nr:radical SAM protein [candidate division WOR-3 bacterium]MBD3364708.1 radical SAM protein [candidate division WOR-3 bacterium]